MLCWVERRKSHFMRFQKTSLKFFPHFFQPAIESPRKTPIKKLWKEASLLCVREPSEKKWSECFCDEMWEHNSAGSCTRWRELWTFHSRRRPDNLVQSNSRLSGGVSGAINRATWAKFRGVVDACPGKLREGKSFSSQQQHQSAIQREKEQPLSHTRVYLK